MDKIDFLDYNRLEKWLQEQVDKERQRINRDAHDKVYNRLASLAHITENALQSRKVPKDTLKLLHQSLREINYELRKIINSQEEGMEDDINRETVDQLLRICRRHAATYGQELQLTCWPKDQLKFEAKDYWHIECILQECLNNIGKHSEADVIKMSVESDDKYYTVRVKDDGKGISKSGFASGNGLKSIYERAKLLGGHLNINSNSKGTNVTLKIPVN